MGGVGLVVGDKRRFIVRPAAIDPLVQPGVMQQQRRLNFRYICRRRLAPVKRNRRGQFRERHRQGVAHPAAIAKPDAAHFAGAVIARQQMLDTGKEGFCRKIFLFSDLQPIDISAASFNSSIGAYYGD